MQPGGCAVPRGGQHPIANNNEARVKSLLLLLLLIYLFLLLKSQMVK
jgi:hypothetical protein